MKNRIVFQLPIISLSLLMIMKSSYCQTKLSGEQKIPPELIIEISEFLHPQDTLGKIANLNQKHRKLIFGSDYLRKISPYGVQNSLSKKWYFYQELQNFPFFFPKLHFNSIKTLISEISPEKLTTLSQAFEGRNPEFFEAIGKGALSAKIRINSALILPKNTEPWRKKAYQTLYTMFAFYECYWNSVKKSASEALWCESPSSARKSAESLAWFAAQESELSQVMRNLTYARMEADIDAGDKSWQKLLKSANKLTGSYTEKVEWSLRNEISLSNNTVISPDPALNQESSERLTLLYYLSDKNSDLMKSIAIQSDIVIQVQSANIFQNLDSWKSYRKKYFDHPNHLLIQPWLKEIDQLVSHGN